VRKPDALQGAIEAIAQEPADPIRGLLLGRSALKRLTGLIKAATLASEDCEDRYVVNCPRQMVTPPRRTRT